MPATRYFVTYMPIEHINGKLANTQIKVKNAASEEVKNDVAFSYGYRHKNSNKSFFGVRQNPRYLDKNPYTESEQENRTLFALSLQVVRENFKTANYYLCLQDFNKQNRYITPFGFAVAAVRANGGNWLEDWIAG